MWGARFALVVLLVALAVVPTSGQEPDREGAPFHEGDVACPRIALIVTLGAGDAPPDDVLATLVDRHAATTMFVTAGFGRAHPAFLREASSSGLMVAPYSEQLPMAGSGFDAAVRHSIHDAAGTIESATGRSSAPFFAAEVWDAEGRGVAVAAVDGLHPIGWAVSTPAPNEKSTEEAVFRSVVDNAYPGAVVRLRAADPALAGALPRILDDLRARGYGLVTMEEILERCPGPMPDRPETITMTGLDVHGLHCTSAPSQGATVIRVLLSGDTVVVRGPVFDGWVPVKCAGREGWVRAGGLPGFGGPQR